MRYCSFLLAMVVSFGWITAFGSDFHIDSIIQIPGGISSSKTGGRTESYYVLDACRVSKTQWFTVLKYSSANFDPWTEEAIKKAKESGSHVVQGVKIDNVVQEMIPAMVGKSGRILLLSNVGLPMQSHSDWGPWPRVFEIEDQKECPYVVLDNAGRTVNCLGYSLEAKASHDIPLHDIQDGIITQDGKGYNLWVFGAGLNGKDRERNAKKTSDANLETSSKSIGKIFNFKQVKWTNINVKPLDLWESVKRLASNPEGEKIELSPDHLFWLPVQGSGFSDQVEIVLEAFEKNAGPEIVLDKPYAQYGRKHFFKIALNKDMVLKASPLHYWMEYGDVSEITIDEKMGVMQFPRIFRPIKEFAYANKGSGLMYYFMGGVQIPGQNNEYSDSGELDVIKYFVSFPTVNSDPEFLDEYAIRTESAKQSKSAGGDVRCLARGLIGRSADNEFLFDGKCMSKKSGSVYCLMTVRID